MTTAMTAGPPRTRRTGDPRNLTLDLGLEIRAWHGIGQTQQAGGPMCAHCMPAERWPCAPFRLAQHVVETLTRAEPYGILAENAYLREVVEGERPGERSAWFGAQ